MGVTPVTLASFQGPFTRFWTTNPTASAFTAPTTSLLETTAPTLAQMSGLGYLRVPPSAMNIALNFFGEGADNATGHARLWGLRAYQNANTPGDTINYLWVPLLEVTSLTLSSAIGAAGRILTATERWCDGYTSISYATEGTDVLSRPAAAGTLANIGVASFIRDLEMCSYVYLDVDMVTTTSLNGFAAFC